MIRNAMITFIVLGVAMPLSSFANDWPSWRGPEQSGMSREKAAVTEWSPDGKNLLWKTPIGGRTTPIVMNGRLFLLAPSGSGECLQERVMCLDAETGETIWEKHFSVFHTDIVEARLGWTSLVGDPETGNVYAHLTGGEFVCLDRNGKILWKHSLGEEFGRYSGYGGRLHTPIIDEQLVIIPYQYILSNWGTGKRKAGHRFVGFNKHTGVVEWLAQPGGRPLDTTYSTPVVAIINGKRMIVTGNADGNVYGMLARTGEQVWSFPLSKRGLNTSVVVDGHYVYASHSEENHDTTEMGRIVCIDASKSGDLTKTGEVWRLDGAGVGYSSPAIANGRLYAVTNSATMLCLDARTGKKHWEHQLGRVMKGSPVVTADGVIYAGEVNGHFHILRDAGDHCESLDVEQFGLRGDANIEINGSPIVANGRVYFMTTFDTYCLGTKDRDASAIHASIPPMAKERSRKDGESFTPVLRLVPAEVTLAPGEEIKFQCRVFDTDGRRVAEQCPSDEDRGWGIKGIHGSMSLDGTFTADPKPAFGAGTITLRSGQTVAGARVRISPKLPIRETFDDMPRGEPPPGWVGLDLSTEIAEHDGRVVLHKMAKSPSAPYSRMRAFSGPSIPIGYTVQAEMMGIPKEGRRPVLSDMGVINGRYTMILLGYEKQVRLVTYAPIPRLQKDQSLDWQPDTWYRMKLSVEPKGDQALIRGKVWPRDEKEPDEWTVEMTDPCPNREGSPGLYAYSKGTTPSKPGASIYFDNYQVYPND